MILFLQAIESLNGKSLGKDSKSPMEVKFPNRIYAAGSYRSSKPDVSDIWFDFVLFSLICCTFSNIRVVF